MPDLQLQDILVKPGKREILRLEQLTLKESEIYAIVGPSGSGKSTFLKVINLLVKPVQGKMHFFGQELSLPHLSGSSRLMVQREMAFVAQKPVMFQTTVFENVAMGLRYRGIDRPTIQKRVDEALEQVGLLESAGQAAHTLSGGEAQRVALARALVLQPKLLLLDEPTSNLDPKNVSIFEQVTRNIHQTFQTTILIVTHHLHQARRLASHCLFIHEGKLVEMADTDSFFQTPKAEDLKAFLSGQMVY